MLINKKIAVVGSREFKNFAQLNSKVVEYIDSEDDEFESGGALGADSMCQRFCKEEGFDIHIRYPKYKVHGKPATFIRNERIVRNSDLVLAFYSKDRFQIGGTANAASWARKLNIPLFEFEEE